jgi:S-adenosylmethionine hydrolase
MNFITLTTDFGYSDYYIAAMKGVILNINPLINIIDVTHNIRKYDLISANYILFSCYQNFPEGTIHTIVVDPGVGSIRKSIVVKTKKYYFVAPDNGVLSMIFSNEMKYEVYEILPKKLKQILNSDISNTFHGRDIFSPVAALISNQTPIENFAKKFESPPVFLDVFSSKQIKNCIETKIIHIDDFGNIIINFCFDKLLQHNINYVEINNQRIYEFSFNYSEIKKIAYLKGSTNFLEVSCCQSSAAVTLNAKIGDRVKIYS